MASDDDEEIVWEELGYDPFFIDAYVLECWVPATHWEAGFDERMGFVRVLSHDGLRELVWIGCLNDGDVAEVIYLLSNRVERYVRGEMDRLIDDLTDELESFG